MEHLIQKGVVDYLLDIGTYIHINQPVIAHIGMYPVGKEDINQLILGVGPGQGSGESGVPETGGRSTIAGGPGILLPEYRFIETKSPVISSWQL
jgi:hypothetical protein